MDEEKPAFKMSLLEELAKGCHSVQVCWLAAQNTMLECKTSDHKVPRFRDLILVKFVTNRYVSINNPFQLFSLRRLKIERQVKGTDQP